MTYYYKVLRAGGLGPHSDVQWPLPAEGEEWGEWMLPILGKLVPCKRGYHVVTIWQLPYWIGECIHPAQVRGQVLVDCDKTLAREAKVGRAIAAWTPAVMAVFARACAERAKRYSDSPFYVENAISCADACAFNTSRAHLARACVELAKRCSDSPPYVENAISCADACADNASRSRLASDAYTSYAALYARAAAKNAANAAFTSAIDEPTAACVAEREWQARWLAKRLGLPIMPDEDEEDRNGRED